MPVSHTRAHRIESNPTLTKQLTHALLFSVLYAVRGLFPLENRPGMVSLLAGKPNAATFPFKSISIELKPVVPGDKEETLVVESEALTEGLQYGPTAGLGKLVDWLEQLQEHRHSRTRDGSWRVSVGSGSQDLINKVQFERARSLRAVEIELTDECFVIFSGYERSRESRGFNLARKSLLPVSQWTDTS